MLTLKEFLDGLQTPTTKLNVKQLREREDYWRTLWGWLDDEVKYFLLRTGQIVRVVRRDYRGSTGELGNIKWERKETELQVYEKHYNEQDGKYHYETKTVLIPQGAIQFLEFIFDDKLAEVVDVPEIGNLPNVEDTTSKSTTLDAVEQ